MKKQPSLKSLLMILSLFNDCDDNDLELMIITTIILSDLNVYCDKNMIIK